MRDDSCFGNREEMIARYKALKTENARLRSSVGALVEALRFYAERGHYVFDGEPDDWESVSGEQENWLCALSIPPHDKEVDLSWMIEDGGIARAALSVNELDTSSLEYQRQLDNTLTSIGVTSPIKRAALGEEVHGVGTQMCPSCGMRFRPHGDGMGADLYGREQDWDCARCGQRNDGWATKCGRCEEVRAKTPAERYAEERPPLDTQKPD